MKRALLVVVLLLLFAANVSAAWLDPTLEERIATAADNGPIGSYVILRDRVDLRGLLNELEAEKADFARRHFAIITTFQDHAAITQESLLAFLEQAKDEGLVKSYRSFWIDNAVRVVAYPEFYDILAEREDIDKIYFDYEIELIEPVRVGSGDARGSRGVEVGITLTRAPELWELGIDGTGVIAADIDTGCDGSHPAFQSRWRGLDVDPSAAWYDPAQGTDFPYDSGHHGTHTMGTILGDDGGENQIGMAPGAKWIAAAVVDVPGVSIFTEAVAAFEWCADPDGNPGTTDDVPAVANNSWGISGFPHCADDFWASMDTAEAAGVAVIFAAGNEGPMQKSLRSPADRITSQFNSFSVGALKPTGDKITSFSSRGPSRCDNATIKPEVSAVGQEVRSSIPDGEYTEMDGTSMAAPHVSGAICLLRQAYPDATVDELKMALYYTAVDLGDAGEDNVYGRGRIDVVAAYDFLSNMCDKDGDTYEDPSCGGNDCNDGDATIYPGATELCDGQDNNCDDTTPADELDPDGDGFAACAGDCAPNNNKIYPGRRELCNGVDDNCDDKLMEGEDDPDGDDHFACLDDCDPNNGDVYPGAEELCDGIDNNCDTYLGIDEVDADVDTYMECAECDDTDPLVNPGAVELCNDGKDNDCNDLIDGDDPACQTTDDDQTDDDASADDDAIDDDTTGDDDTSPAPIDDDDDDDDDACGC